METEETQRPVRYQDSPWYVRLWRRRWYLTIPFWTFQNWRSLWRENDGSLAKEDPWLTWNLAYAIAIGEAQAQMHWYYTMEEVEERFLERRRKKK